MGAERAVQRHFRREGLTRHSLSAAKVAFGRFEATRPNELWVGDALHGPIMGRHKAILLAFLDDHSRLVTGYRWVTAEDTVRAEAALRWGWRHGGYPTPCTWIMPTFALCRPRVRNRCGGSCR